MSKQTLEERLKRTLVTMQRCEEDSPIDICHFQAVNDAISELSRLTRERDALQATVAKMAASGFRLTKALRSLGRRMEVHELVGKEDDMGKTDQIEYDEAMAAYEEWRLLIAAERAKGVE